MIVDQIKTFKILAFLIMTDISEYLSNWKLTVKTNFEN